jgi:hypothetical protein
MQMITTDKLSFIRPGDSGPRHVTRSSRKVQSESDEDFIIEGNEDSASCSEDDKDITDEEDNGVSGDSSSREIVKPKASQKGKGRGNKEKSPEDGDSSDEEVCSVCEVLNIILCYKSFLPLRVFDIDVVSRCTFFCLEL